MSFSCHKVAIQKKHKQLIVNKLERICDDGEKEVPKVLFNDPTNDNSPYSLNCVYIRFITGCKIIFKNIKILQNSKYL
jgi:hypothetical protein